MIVLHLEPAPFYLFVDPFLCGNHISDCNINGTCGGYVMDDGRPLKAKVPHILNSILLLLLLLLHLNFKKGREKCREEWAKDCQRNSQIPNSLLSFKSQGM
jgi:hypothetical protein